MWLRLITLEFLDLGNQEFFGSFERSKNLILYIDSFHLHATAVDDIDHGTVKRNLSGVYCTCIMTALPKRRLINEKRNGLCSRQFKLLAILFCHQL